MSVVLVFLALLLLMFGVLAYLTKPTAMEKAVEDQLANIEGEQAATGFGAATILKNQAVRSNELENFARLLPWSESASRLIKQAGKTWSFGYLSLLSAIGALVTYGLAVWANTAVPI